MNDAWRCRSIARRATAVVRPEDRARMYGDGLDKADIGAVQNHLTMLRVNGLISTKPHPLAALLESAGFRPSAMNLAEAQSVYFRGMKLALIERRYGARRVEGMLRSAAMEIAA